MDSLKKENRVFAIKAFRNIGFDDQGTPISEKLFLNYSLNKEYLGDLVILIGPNNSGKSNVLDALECFANQNIANRDKSDNFMNSDQQQPSLSLLNFADGKVVQSFALNVDNELNYNDINSLQYVKPTFSLDHYIDNINEDNAVDYQKEAKFLYEKLLDHNINILNNSLLANKSLQTAVVFIYRGDGVLLRKNINIPVIKDYTKVIYENLMKLYDKSLKDVEEGKFKNIPENISAGPVNLMRPKEVIWMCDENDEDTNEPFSKYAKLFINDYVAYLQKLDKVPASHPTLPKIIRYKQQNICNKDLSCTPDDANKNEFFKSILKVINGDEAQINNAYNTVQRNNSDGILETTADNLNKSLEKIAAYFNKLYCLEDNKYLFKIRLESNKVSFNIFREENDGTKVALVLNHQSTGFRWFFDFFFHVFASNDLKAGDIIIMDEPATNLHVKGQEELRKLLKQFAINNAITFVIATHSPFLVDLDYLDEIRLICLQNNEVAKINDNFTTVNPDDADSLLAIRESLTVRNSILLDPKQVVVFVEGITDYNYFVGMKAISPLYKHIVFLPINGVGKETADKKRRLRELLRMRSLNSIVLTDGDKAGDEFSDLNDDNEYQLKILKLTDVNPSFKEVEDLFSSDDATKFNVASKDSGISATFKKIILKHPKEISQTTIDNFNEVFSKIVSLIKK